MKITYKDAGVDTHKAQKIIKNLIPTITSTYDDNVIGEIGGFAAFYRYGDNVLVSGTDGVGTKLLMYKHYGSYKNVGYDLVAMCVNDIICHGAKPMFFLDYVASSNIKKEMINDVVSSIAKACRLAKIALVGGETAEMPGMYNEDEIDLSGFAVGTVEKNKLITGKNIKENDIIIGIKSNGFHSNGYSLLRKLYLEKSPELFEKYKEELLKPTFIYTDRIMPLIDKFNILGIAHITGGGFYENIPRILPQGLAFKIDSKSWDKAEIITKTVELLNLNLFEAFSTFNMGIGMVIVVDEKDEKEVLNHLGHSSYKIGHVVKGEKSIVI